MKIKEQKFLVEIAKLAATRSTGVRLKVGAVAADWQGNILATGYNGSVRGGDNCLEYKAYAPYDEYTHRYSYNSYKDYNLWCDDELNWYKLITKESTIHAEQNLISYAAKRGVSIDGSSVFVTHSPCHKCTALLIQSGVVEITYIDEHHSCASVKQEFGAMIKIKKMELS